LVFDADEEAGGTLGMRCLLSSYDPQVEMALYAAPTSYADDGARYFDLGVDNIAIGSPGLLQLRLSCTSEIAYHVAPIDWYHASELGMHIAGALREHLATPRWLGGHPRARLVHSVDGNQLWDVFVAPGEDPDELCADVTALITSVVGSHRRADCEIEVKQRIPPASCSPDHPLIEALRLGALEATGRTPTVGILPTVTGMSIIQDALQIPIAAFGYGRIDLCHTTEEAISVDALVASAVAYAEALERLAAEPASQPSTVEEFAA
jgi:acetylornithine deacetylase/succinyl-diaminopimelate desuccinylase-like protein